MSENPYAPPDSEVNDVSIEPDVPDEILKKIKHAWIAGLITGGMTLVFTILAVTGTSLIGFTAWEFFDVALILGLTYGIYKKSRVCATLMLVYFLISKIIVFADSRQATGIVMSLVFIYYYAHGVYGTFVYQKLVKTAINSRDN